MASTCLERVCCGLDPFDRDSRVRALASTILVRLVHRNNPEHRARGTVRVFQLGAQANSSRSF